ncbi:MAG: glycerol-3-phosphate acyltransferase [Acidimicrobiales bacterium]|nr:glycerol-3-phosphate acyltransferase [Acidimicrobiales bacterium]
MNNVYSLRHLGSSAVVGYLLGSFPSAVIATRLAGTGRDLHREGSGNPGAANAMTVLGPGWGAGVLAVDMAKGAAAGWLGRALAGDGGAYLAGTASIAGHIVPVWNRGRGGKGVATSAGACLAVFPAYFPVDTVVAALATTATRGAERSIQISCAAWTVAAVAWWRRRLPNAWGPAPTAALPIFAATSSLMILAKFRATRMRS